MHYYGMGRHLFVDVAVTEPATLQMVNGARSSATEAGVAAEARAQKKYSKYREACARIDCTFTGWGYRAVRALQRWVGGACAAHCWGGTE